MKFHDFCHSEATPISQRTAVNKYFMSFIKGVQNFKQDESQYYKLGN